MLSTTTAPAPPRSRSSSRLPLLYLLFFVSGSCGLIFEIVWIRGLGLQFGTTAPAISTVLAAFMGGLALGNLLLGPVADRHARPLRLYCWLEVGIAASALAVSLLLLRGDGLFAWLASSLAESPDLKTPLRFVITSALLLLPTTLMGGTLPVIARALVRSGSAGRMLGTLYALNTAGAVAGALLPDLLLIPSVGLTATVLLAAAGNLFVAAAVGLVRIPELPEPVGAGSDWLPIPRAPLILYALSGFCAMGYEVLWSRMHQHWSMGQVSSFAVLLATFLVCLAIGSWLTTPLADRVKRPLVPGALLLAATGPAALAPVLISDRWAGLYNQLLPSIRGVHRAEPGQALALAVANAVYIEAAACLLLGAAFPFLAAAAVAGRDPGRATGRLIAANTLCGVAGAVLAGFVLLPALGVQTALLGLAGLALCGGAATAGVQAAGERRTLAAVATLLIGGTAMAVTLPPDRLERAYFAGFHSAETRIVELREGSTTTAAVAVRDRWGQPAYMQLLTPGVTMSDTQLGAQRYMGLMGHLPLLLSEERSEALLICYGVGNTARSLLSHSSLDRLDVVDISPEVLSMSARFSPVHGGDPLADPRVEVRVEDGRQHLLATSRRYDVITSEPPPPTDAGVVNLYTQEFNAAARQALKPGGVLAQWLPLFQLSEAETASIVAAFVAEFDHTALYYGYRYQWILLGSDRPLDPERLTRGLLPGRAWDDLESVGVRLPEDLHGALLQDDAGLRSVALGREPVTDDLPSLQYPRVGLHGEVQVPEGLARGAAGPVVDALPHLTDRPPELRELRLGQILGPELAARPGDLHLLSLLRIGEDWSGPARQHLQGGGSDPEAQLVLARLAFYEGRWAEALERLEGLTPRESDRVRRELLRGASLAALGRGLEARGVLEAAAAASSSEPFREEVRRLLSSLARPREEGQHPLSP